MTDVFILLGLILLNAVFVMSEIALISARRSKLESLAAKGDQSAQNVIKLQDNPEQFLSTLQIGITLVSILTGVYSGDKFSKHLVPFFEQFDLTRPYASTLATTVIVVIVTFLSIIIGELIPKKFGLLRAEKLARFIARPMKILSTIMHPFVWLLSNTTNLIFNLFNIQKASDSAITEEEIKQLITESSEHGDIEEGEKEIIERVFHLGDRNITSLMTHRTDIVWVDMKDTIADVKREIKDFVFSSFPICEDTIDNIKGLVHVKDMVKASPTDTMASLLKPALYVPRNLKAYKLLEKMKASKIHTGFVVNEYGTLEGMVTLNDILEAIVGDVPQTGQEEYEIIAREDGSYLVEAQLPFYDFLSYFERADWSAESDEFDTVAGFVLHELNDIPKVGEKFSWRDFNFEIIDMDGQRIDKILLTISEELKEELEEE